MGGPVGVARTALTTLQVGSLLEFVRIFGNGLHVGVGEGYSPGPSLVLTAVGRGGGGGFAACCQILPIPGCVPATPGGGGRKGTPGRRCRWGRRRAETIPHPTRRLEQTITRRKQTQATHAEDLKQTLSEKSWPRYPASDPGTLPQSPNRNRRPPPLRQRSQTQSPAPASPPAPPPTTEGATTASKTPSVKPPS